MKALVKEGQHLAVRHLPRPRIDAPDDVVIRVVAAGVCRTDVYVAEGRLPSQDPVVLGHEFSGVVSEAGPEAGGLFPGDRVTAFPLIPCGTCPACESGESSAGPRCRRPAMLGVQRHGAFAEYVVVPRAMVHRLPPGLSFFAGAYAEPVAAALASLRAGLRQGQRGLIYGDNRIATLVRRVLRAHGFTDVVTHDPSGPPPERDSYDFLIETVATSQAMAEMIAAARPGGKIVLRSRPWQPVALDLLSAVPKELTFAAVYYGSMTEAVALLAERRVEVDDLLGQAHELEAFEQVFRESLRSDSNKLFFTFGTE